MDLRITSSGLVEDLTDEVYRTLYLIGVSSLLAFDHNCCADDARGSGDGLLNLGPLSDEINERLRLDRRPTSEFNGVSAELDHPFHDMAVGLFVAKDVS